MDRKTLILNLQLFSRTLTDERIKEISNDIEKLLFEYMEKSSRTREPLAMKLEINPSDKANTPQ